MNHLNLSNDNIVTSFGHTILKRGEALHKQKKVVSFKFEEDLDIIQGKVLGSANDLYSVDIIFHGVDLFESECDCHYGYMCKHGAALLLAFRDKHRPAIPSKNLSLDRWLKYYSETQQKTAFQSGEQLSLFRPAQWNLLFTLDPSNPRSPFCLKFYILKNQAAGEENNQYTHPT